MKRMKMTKTEKEKEKERVKERMKGKETERTKNPLLRTNEAGNNEEVEGTERE